MLSAIRSTFYMGQALTAPAKLTRAQPYSAGMKCAILLLLITIPIKNNAGTAQTPTRADVDSFLLCIMNKFSLTFGLQSKQNVDKGNAYADARDFERLISRKDYLVSTAASGWVELGSLAATDAVAAAMNAGTAINISVLWKRSFELPDLGPDRYSRCPGEEQMRQVNIEINSAGTFSTNNANLVLNGQVQFDYMTEDVPAEDHEASEWVMPIRLYRTNVADREQVGPAGALYACWEATNPGASCPIDIFSLTRKEGDHLIWDAKVQDVVATTSLRDALGLASYNADQTTKTLFYRPQAPARIDDLPTSNGWGFIQPGNEIATPSMRWAYLSPQGEAFLQSVAQNVTGLSKEEGGIGSEARAVNADAYHGRRVLPAIAATAGVAIMRPGAAQFHALPSIPMLAGSIHPAVIPEHVQQVAERAIGAASAHAEHGVSANVATGIARFVPGWLSPSNATAALTAKAKVGQSGGLLGELAARFRRLF